MISRVFFAVNLNIRSFLPEDATNRAQTRIPCDQWLRHTEPFRPSSACRSCTQRVQWQACPIHSLALTPVGSSFADLSRKQQECAHIALIGAEKSGDSERPA